MSQTATKRSTVRITITTSKSVHEHLGRLVTLGLYGNSVADAAERIVCEGLRNDVRRKRAALVDPKPEVAT